MRAACVLSVEAVARQFRQVERGGAGRLCCTVEAEAVGALLPGRQIGTASALAASARGNNQGRRGIHRLDTSGLRRARTRRQLAL